MSAFRILVVVAMVFALLGCTTLQVVHGSNPSEIQRQVKPGDHVTVMTNQGGRYEFDVTTVSQNNIIGINDSKPYKFSFSQIRSIEVSKASKGKTNGLVFGVRGAIAVVGAIVLFGSLIRAGKSN